MRGAVGGAFHATLVVVYINREQGTEESPFGRKSCVAAEKCERTPVHDVAQCRLINGREEHNGRHNPTLFKFALEPQLTVIPRR